MTVTAIRAGSGKTIWERWKSGDAAETPEEIARYREYDAALTRITRMRAFPEPGRSRS